MTAVASPPSFQPLPRIQWNTNNSGQGGLNNMSADDVTRMFMPRKSAQRANSSSSVSSNSSTSSTVTSFQVPASSPITNGDTPTINGDQGGWNNRKKPAKGVWPSAKSEPVTGNSIARPQPLPPSTSGQSAASNLAAIHQPSHSIPSQGRTPQIQQNGGRIEPSPTQTEPPTLLVLTPITGNWERKHMSVPYLPEVLRIGRQTNAKTVPTPVNGYFDSKVLSRQHAEVWADRNGKVWIRDIKSSNGTFVNAYRLSPENRDSEPHELRENDTLELGIDIVSEDQKSIVHHKVSAKVEHAGVYANGSNVLDLNFGDIDSNNGNGIMGPPVPQPMSQPRGRGSNQNSNNSNCRLSATSGIAGSNVSGMGMGPQRHMNYWMNPITIEQVVKKLTTELKQAKQQQQDLNHASDFFRTLLNQDLGQEPPQSKAEEESKEMIPNGIPSPTKFDAISPFSQPPAPPPQQPLPEKPDSAPLNMMPPITQPSLKRTETERPRSEVSSPVRNEAPSSETLSLLQALQALNSAKREIDVQGDRVKHLENLLMEERKARESAEERARSLLENRPSEYDDGSSTFVKDAVFDAPSAAADEDNPTNGDPRSDDRAASPIDPSKSPEQFRPSTNDVDASTSRLQERLVLMVREMDEMKLTMESYRCRAEGAEAERSTLAEMVESIRAANSSPTSHLVNGIVKDFDDTATGSNRYEDETAKLNSFVSRRPSSTHQHQQRNSLLGMALEKKLKDEEWRGAPWASMVGVVLIGVGLMTYLNGWQAAERVVK